MLAALLLVAPAALPALPQDQDPAAEFRTRFESALRARDRQEMGRVIRRYKEAAIPVFIAKADLRAVNPHEELNRWVDGFIEAWDEAYGTGFARNYDRYLQLMNSARRGIRDKMMERGIPALDALHQAAAKSRSRGAWARLQAELPALVRSAEAAGDLYQLAWMRAVEGNSWNPGFNPEGADPQKALDAYQACLDARDRLGLDNDLLYVNTKKSANEMRALLGIADPETGEVPEVMHAPEEILPKDKDAWVEVAMEASVDRKPGSRVHPSDMDDGQFQAWRVGSAGAVGETRALGGIDPPVEVKRTGLNKFVLICGGLESRPFKLATKPVLVTYPRKHADGTEDEHALLFGVGAQQDSFQDSGMNLAPQPEGVTLFFRSPAARSAETPFGPLTVYDLNTDGRFGYLQSELIGMLGMGTALDGQPQYAHRYDGVRIGKGRGSVPYSRWITDGSLWFELENGDPATGMALRLREAVPRTGTIKVLVKGIKSLRPVSLVFRADSPLTKGLYVDPASARGGTAEVPIGRYVFEQGLLRHPKRNQECIVVPGSQPLAVEVKEGETAEVLLGAPFRLAAAIQREPNAVVVAGRSLRVVGAAGEQYVRFVGAPLYSAEVSVKGARSGRLKRPTAEDISVKDWNFAFYPLDARVEARDGEHAPVRLTVKKHPWFGPLDSGWME